MPYIPHLGTDGRGLSLVHTGLYHVVSRSLSHLNDPPSTSLEGRHQHQTLEMRGLGNFHAVNASAIYDMKQQTIRQVVATTTSSVSLASALVAVYWFFMMRRNFRRDLVLLLILGGAWKSLWFVVFSVYSFAHGQVETETAFCQANGYLLQVGFESCDVAVLFMSMHMYYQIFPTPLFGLNHDGLYRIRKWVYALFIILPNLSAAIAFVNPRPAFMAQGGFCSLPLRPFWYRIALFWGPRYLIWCYVVFVAVRIYRYVGSEFKVFGQERDRSESLGVPGDSSVDRMMKTQMEKEGERQRRRSRGIESLGLGSGIGDEDEECAPDDTCGVCSIRPRTASANDSPKIGGMSAARRQSTPNWTFPMGGIDEDSTAIVPLSQSYPSSRRGSQQIQPGVTAEDFAPTPPQLPSLSQIQAQSQPSNGHRGSIASLASKTPSFAGSLDHPSGLPSITEGKKSTVDPEKSRPTASGAMKLRRRLIQRQLRLLFIYPCIYMLFWILPLVVNIMNYTDYFAQHPIFSLGIVQLVCITIMTFADVIVFCWRERPWRHIPGSDGTFTGSFMFWRICFGSTWMRDRRASRAASQIPNEKGVGDSNGSRSGLLNSIKRWSMSLAGQSPRGSDASTNAPASKKPTNTNRRTFSGGSDRKQMEADRAHERLALERADYEQNRRSFQERRLSVMSQMQQPPVEQSRKEWFDQDGDLFTDHENSIDETRAST